MNSSSPLNPNLPGLWFLQGDLGIYGGAFYRPKIGDGFSRDPTNDLLAFVVLGTFLAKKSYLGVLSLNSLSLDTLDGFLWVKKSGETFFCDELRLSSSNLFY